MKQTKKEFIEKLNKARRESSFDKGAEIYKYLYIICNKKNHDSGYKTMNIYGEKENGDIILLSTFSDVINFEKVYEQSWFMSFDFPYYNVLRLFPRRDYLFNIPFTFCSSFTINLLKRS